MEELFAAAAGQRVRERRLHVLRALLQPAVRHADMHAGEGAGQAGEELDKGAAAELLRRHVNDALHACAAVSVSGPGAA